MTLVVFLEMWGDYYLTRNVINIPPRQEPSASPAKSSIKVTPARTDGSAEDPPKAVVQAEEAGSVMQLPRLEQVDSEHFPKNHPGPNSV